MIEKGKLIAKVGEPKRTPSGIITGVNNTPLRKRGLSGAPVIIDNEEDLSTLAKKFPELFEYNSTAKELRMK